MSASDAIEILRVLVFAALVFAVASALFWRARGRDPWRAGIYGYLVTVALALAIIGGLELAGLSGLVLAGIVGVAAGRAAPKIGAASAQSSAQPSAKSSAQTSAQSSARFGWPAFLRSVGAAARKVKPAPTATPEPAPPGVFISYRRTDAPSAAGRLYDHLAAAIGESRVFKDVDSIPPGVDFDRHITRFIRSGATVLALIGPRWLEGENGRRLAEETDPVRREIELARRCGARLIPVLIEDATMPRAEALPPSIAFLVRINALRLRADPDFRRDVEGVIETVKTPG